MLLQNVLLGSISVLAVLIETNSCERHEKSLLLFFVCWRKTMKVIRRKKWTFDLWQCLLFPAQKENMIPWRSCLSFLFALRHVTIFSWSFSPLASILPPMSFWLNNDHLETLLSRRQLETVLSLWNVRRGSTAKYLLRFSFTVKMSFVLSCYCLL